MKKILLFSLLCLLAFTTTAQELNFEETVQYIRSKIKDFPYDSRCEGTGIFTAKPNGELKFDNTSNYKFNLFDLNNKQKKDWQNTDEFGIAISHSALDNGNTLIPGINFMADGGAIADLSFKRDIPLVEMQRIRNALIHLRSLCKKEKDAFDN